MTLSVVLLSAGQRLRQLMPSPGVRANICRGFIFYRLHISCQVIQLNLRGVNQRNLSVLAAPLWELHVMIRAKGLSEVCFHLISNYVFS